MTATHGRRSLRPSVGAANGSADVRPSSLAGTVGSRNGRFRCTGPGGAPSPTAAATARATTERQCGGASSRSSATPTSQNQRTLPPNRWSWSMAWLAPVPRSSGGRSAVSRSSGTPPVSASMTAGCRFATAEPEVTTTAAGRPLPRPRPIARKPGRALVHLDVQPDPRVVVQRHRERRRSRPGREHGVGHPAPGQLVDEDERLGVRRVLGAHRAAFSRRGVRTRHRAAR